MVMSNPVISEHCPVPIRARRTRFDLSETPCHWIPDDPQTTHTINVLHVVLPPGERWFCDVYRDALPLVTDAQLRDDMRGFIGQEATHAKAHDLGLEHLARHGIDLRRQVAFADRARVRLRKRLRRLPGPVFRRILTGELAAIAAIEHFTGVLGDWVIDAGALEDAGADPAMVDLLRWHGAEEVEHRSVAFDAYQHLSGNYPRRVIAMGLVFVGLNLGWIAVTQRLMALDQSGPRRFRISEVRRAERQQRLPRYRDIVGSVPRYARRGHHPSSIGSTEKALAYLATSPGVAARARKSA
jgi:predicted metal-dependent hydrolase